MKLIPYSNVFENDIPDKDSFKDWKREQLVDFRDELISKGTIRQYYVNEYGEFKVKGRDSDNYWLDIVTLFNNSRYDGFPYWKVPLELLNDSLDESNHQYLNVDLHKDFTEDWSSFYFSNSTISQTTEIYEKTSWNIDELTITNDYKTKSFAGKVSHKEYKNYIFDVEMSSTFDDSGELAVVVARKELNGKRDYTISAVRSPNSWFLVFNYKQPDEKILIDKSDTLDVSTNWNINPLGTRIRAIVNDSKITVYTSQMNSHALEESTMIVYDIKWDKQVLPLLETRNVGVAVLGQQDSTFKLLEFVEFGETYPNFLGKTITMLFRGDNYSGRHLVPKYMNHLDYTKMLLVDDSHELGDGNIIATIYPMFRTIVVGYHVTGMTNGGTDLIPSVESIQDIKNIMGILYSRKEFAKYNIFIEGDIIQGYINHLYLEGERLNETHNLERDWLDMYVLPDIFIDRMNTRVTKQYFDIWGYHKFPYTLPHYPSVTDRMLKATTEFRDKESYKDDLGDRKRSIYPCTVSLRRVSGPSMLMGLLCGENVEKIEHYKVTGPVSCIRELPEFKIPLSEAEKVEIPDLHPEWDTEETKESEIVEAIGGEMHEELSWNTIPLDYNDYVRFKFWTVGARFSISNHLISIYRRPNESVLIDDINSVTQEEYQENGLPEVQAVVFNHILETVESESAIYNEGRLGISNQGFYYSDYLKSVNIAGIEVGELEYVTLVYDDKVDAVVVEPTYESNEIVHGDLWNELNFGIPKYLVDLLDDQDHYTNIYNYDKSVRMLTKTDMPEEYYIDEQPKFRSNKDNYNLYLDRFRVCGAGSGYHVTPHFEYTKEFKTLNNEVVALVATDYVFEDYVHDRFVTDLGNEVLIPGTCGYCTDLTDGATEEVQYTSIECIVNVPRGVYKSINVYEPATRFPSILNHNNEPAADVGVYEETKVIHHSNVNRVLWHDTYIHEDGINKDKYYNKIIESYPDYPNIITDECKQFIADMIADDEQDNGRVSYTVSFVEVLRRDSID